MPQIMALVSNTSKNEETKVAENKKVTKQSNGKKASGGRPISRLPWWEQIGSWFRSTFGWGSIHIPTNSYI